MGILTNFLKLLKPEPNDFVDVAKHISENYDKLDQNAKSNNETLTNLSNNKLDKGTYSGNASNLKSEIDGKVSKSGDTMTDALTISASKYPGIIFNGPDIAAIGYSVENKYTYIKASTGTGLRIYSDNTATLQANNLNTKNKEVVAAINENYEKFKNFCPYSIGDIYITTLSINPATRFLGTTWEKIEGRFLLATSGSNASGATGGSNTKTISKANLPNIKLQVDSFALTTQPHTHNVKGRHGWSDGTTYMTMQNAQTAWGTVVTESGGGQNTGTASPYTSALGSGTPLDITPSFYTVHIWKRLS